MPPVCVEIDRRGKASKLGDEATVRTYTVVGQGRHWIHPHEMPG